jgi:hypothetical protein
MVAGDRITMTTTGAVQFETASGLVATQPQIIYVDTPHDGFGPMAEVQPR